MKNFKFVLLTVLFFSGIAISTSTTVHAEQYYYNVSKSSDAQKAENAVNALFTDSTHSELAPTTTNDSIQEAKKLILHAIGKCNLDALTKLTTKATQLLLKNGGPKVSVNADAQKAEAAVNALFTDSTHSELAPTTTNDSIQEAKKLVLKALGKCNLDALTKLTTKATQLLLENGGPKVSVNADAQKAENAVNALFTDSTHSKLAPTTTYKTIQEAKKIVLKAIGKCDLNALTKLITKANQLLLESSKF